MSWHQSACVSETCKKINWVHVSEDPCGFDYDGFKCYGCGRKQLWPDMEAGDEPDDPTFAEGRAPPIWPAEKERVSLTTIGDRLDEIRNDLNITRLLEDDA